MTKRTKIIICLIVAIVLVFGGIAIYQLTRSLNYVSNIVLTTPDISGIDDGVYNGVFDTPVLSAEVDVTVEDHKIIDIVINNHNHGRGGDAEKIIDDVITNQSVEIDAISGATNSSKVILKAIQNALEGGSN